MDIFFMISVLIVNLLRVNVPSEHDQQQTPLHTAHSQKPPQTTWYTRFFGGRGVIFIELSTPKHGKLIHPAVMM